MAQVQHSKTIIKLSKIILIYIENKYNSPVIDDH